MTNGEICTAIDDIHAAVKLEKEKKVSIDESVLIRDKCKAALKRIRLVMYKHLRIEFGFSFKRSHLLVDRFYLILMNRFGRGYRRSELARKTEFSSIYIGRLEEDALKLLDSIKKYCTY